MNGRDILIYLSIKYQGNWEKIFLDIKNRKKDFTSDEVKEAVASVKSKVVTIIDREYPEAFKNQQKPPFVLYYYGDLSLLDNPKRNIAVIGSRKNSDYGREMTIKITSDIAKHFIIVSGLARGIDAIAHQTAINSGGKTVAILGSGIDYCYPRENIDLYKRIKEEHLLISEYPNNTEPNKENFPMRNRIIAMASDCVVLTEGHMRSGSFITIGYALNKGSEICCVPYLANQDSACNRLIKEGARLVETADDVFDEIGFIPPKPAEPVHDDEELD